jgi:hypothetical protein
MAPTALDAQQLHPPIVAAPRVVAVIDIDRIVRACTQCRVASAALQTRAQVLQARANQLASVLATEARALQPLIAAIPRGGQPEPALRVRIQTFERARVSAEREIAQRREQLQRDVEFVRVQIRGRMEPAMRTVMRRHGATDFVERGTARDRRRRIDITGEVLAILDQNNEPFDLHAAPPPRAHRHPIV